MSKVMQIQFPGNLIPIDWSDPDDEYCRIGRSECTSLGITLVFPALMGYLANVAGVAVGEQRGCPTHPVEDGCRHVGCEPGIPAAYGTA